GYNVTGSNNVAIANVGVAGESRAIRIGTAATHNAAYIAGVTGAAIPGPTQPVLVNSSGRLGTATSSSAALKRDVEAIDARAAGRVLGLRPVRYRYRTGDDRLQLGLIAEDVDRRVPEL